MNLRSALIAEFLGTASLLIIIVGSGISGETLSQGNEAIALLANSIATGAGLFVLIQCLGSISGAHFNPVVSLIESIGGRLNQRMLISYWCAQFSGAILGVFIAHVMFHQSIFQVSSKKRLGFNLAFSEVAATFGLICVIALARRKHPEYASVSIAAYITGAYWFTSSTSFANPAVTVARMFTDTFCGIAPHGVIPFIVAQVIGSLLAFIFLKSVSGQRFGPMKKSSI